MSRKSRLEKHLKNQSKVDKATAKKMKNREKALAVTDVATGFALKAATPAVASAAGVAAASGAIALVFPIGTIIAAVPLAVSLGFSIAQKSKSKKAKYLTKDQKTLVEMVNKYKKKSADWRKKKADKLLKSYEKHLDRGNKKAFLRLRKNTRSEKTSWKSKKAKLEMEMTAIYMAEYEEKPPTKKTKRGGSRRGMSYDQLRSRKLMQRIQGKQKASIEPILSPFLVQDNQIRVNQQQLKKQTIRMLQRPSEVTDTIRQLPPKPPQPISLTLKQSPLALPKETNWLLIGGVTMGVLSLTGLGIFVATREKSQT